MILNFKQCIVTKVTVNFRPTVTCKKNDLSLAQLLVDRRLEVIVVPGDGLCLIHAVKIVLSNDERFDTTEVIAEPVRSEVRRNLPQYEPFFRRLAQVQQF